MSSPHIDVGSGTRAPVTAFQRAPSAVHGETSTQTISAMAAGTAPSVASHGRAPTVTGAMQWRTVSTTFGLTKVPEHAMDAALGAPRAIATAWLVARSSVPPSTARASGATASIAAVIADPSLKDTNTSP